MATKKQTKTIIAACECGFCGKSDALLGVLLEGKALKFCDEDCLHAWTRDEVKEEIEGHINHDILEMASLTQAKKHPKYKGLRFTNHFDNHYKQMFARRMMYQGLLDRKPKAMLERMRDALVIKTETLFNELDEDKAGKERFPTLYYETAQDLVPEYRTLYWDSLIEAWGV